MIRLTEITDLEGNTTCYEYDPNGNLTAITSALGHRTEITYDALDRQEKITQPDGSITELTYDPFGNIIEIKDALGNITKREYDPAGQLISLTDPLNNTTKLTYTTLGQIQTITDPKGDARTFEYYPGGKLKSVVFSTGETESYFYDENGNPIKTVTDISETSFVYDTGDRVVEVINPSGSKKFSYDAMGNIISSTDENNNTTMYKYSPLGQLTEVTDPAGINTKYNYDKVGRLTGFVNHTQITTYKYNKKGEVVEIVTPLGETIKYTCNGAGNVISKTDEANQETLYRYNYANKLTQVTYADGNSVKLSYNPLNQLTQMEDRLGINIFKLDPLGRPVKITDPKGNEVSYKWNETDQKEEITYPDGSKVNYRYDPLGRIKQVISKEGITNYSYNLQQGEALRILPDNTITKYQTDLQGRLKTLTHSKDNNILDSFNYTYDPAGNIIQIEKHRQGAEIDSGIFQYAYDPLNRLISAVHLHQNQSVKTQSFAYDSLGNRIKEKTDGVTTNHTYNTRNQLIRTETRDITKEYRYDSRGNLTSILENGEIHSRFTFNAANLMVNAVTPKGVAEYVYNGFRNRVKKVETLHDPITGIHNPTINLDPTSELNYILDLTLPYDNLLMTEGTHNQSFVWGNELIGAIGEESYGYLQDHLGSPIRLMGKDTDNIFAYDVFGKELLANTTNPFGFTGYQHDNVTDLYYAQARYYNPVSGHFVAEDPIKGFAELPFTLNHYTYCSNNPLIFIDKDGLFLRRIGNTVSNAWNTTTDVVSSGWNTATGAVSDWYNSLPNWGQNLVTVGVVLVGSATVAALTVVSLGVFAPLAIKAVLPSVGIGWIVAGTVTGSSISMGVNAILQGFVTGNWAEIDSRQLRNAGILGGISGFFGSTALGIGSLIFINATLNGTAGLIRELNSENNSLWQLSAISIVIDVILGGIAGGLGGAGLLHGTTNISKQVRNVRFNIIDEKINYNIRILNQLPSNFLRGGLIGITTEGIINLIDNLIREFLEDRFLIDVEGVYCE